MKPFALALAVLSIGALSEPALADKAFNKKVGLSIQKTLKGFQPPGYVPVSPGADFAVSIRGAGRALATKVQGIAAQARPRRR